jgi:hypothetical protein
MRALILGLKSYKSVNTVPRATVKGRPSFAALTGLDHTGVGLDVLLCPIAIGHSLVVRVQMRLLQ